MSRFQTVYLTTAIHFDELMSATYIKTAQPWFTHPKNIASESFAKLKETKQLSTKSNTFCLYYYKWLFLKSFWEKGKKCTDDLARRRSKVNSIFVVCACVCGCGLNNLANHTLWFVVWLLLLLLLGLFRFVLTARGKEQKHARTKYDKGCQTHHAGQQNQ